MSSAKRAQIQLPLFCLAKSKQHMDHYFPTPEAKHHLHEQLQVPEPIEEFVDYTIDPNDKRWLYSSPKTDLSSLDFKSDTSSSSDKEKPAVEEFIKVSVLGQAESGLASARGRMKKPAPPNVRRAEGIPISTDRSVDASGRRENIGSGLTQLQDLMVEDVPEDADEQAVSVVPGRESNALATARIATSQSFQETAGSQSEATLAADSSDVRALKRTVRRLTSELSRLLTAHPTDGKPVDEVDSKKLLPGRGPLPPWLCDPRVFAPLMAAYDSQLANAGKNDSSGVDARLLDMEARVLDVVRENERLRLKLRESATAGPASQTDWDAFAEQARLVLEENQLLIRQLSVQQAKAKMAHQGYAEEAAKMKYRIEELEAENAQVRGEFDSLHRKLQEVKNKYQSAALERETGELKTVDCMRSLSKELLDTREEFVRANEELLRQLQKSEREKVKMTRALSDAVTERDSLRIEVSELKSAMQLCHKDALRQQKFAKKQDVLQVHLESVVSAASDMQEELTASRGKLEDQEVELSKLMSYLVSELKFHEKDINGQAFDEESLKKIPKLTSKFEFVIRRFAALLKANEEKRDQMDKQICYLQSLIRQKSLELRHLETENRTVQAGLETILRDAVSN